MYDQLIRRLDRAARLNDRVAVITLSLRLATLSYPDLRTGTADHLRAAWAYEGLAYRGAFHTRP